MDPVTIIGLTNAALTLIEQALPQIQALANKGEITPAQQQAVLDRYNAFKASGDAAFSGPEWQKSGQ